MAVPFTCSQEAIQVAGNPSQLELIDLVDGSTTTVGALTPSGLYNGVGYSIIDNYVYGYRFSDRNIVRISSDATVDGLGTVPNLPNLDYRIGDVDENGYLYLYAQNTARFYVVDVNPSRSTYLQLVDPANSFALQSTPPFGVGTSILNIGDWAFNPIDGNLYTIRRTPLSAVRIDPITGATTNLTTSGIPDGSTYGASFFDSSGTFYTIRNTTGVVYKVEFTPTTATGSVFSNAVASGNNDGARCIRAAVDMATATKSVDLSDALIGDTLTYTIDVKNDSLLVPLTNVVLTDPIDPSTTYVMNSATVDGNPATGDPATGILIGTIPPDTTVTVEYQVVITDIPDPNPLPNTATITFEEGSPVTTNTVFTNVEGPSRGISFLSNEFII